MLSLQVNGIKHELDVDPETPLLWVLREQLGLTGTKYGCGEAECGACTVHVDGRAVLSCVTPVGEVIGSEVITIEGLVGPVGLALIDSWIEEDVSQCGYCQCGQIMTAAALLTDSPNPSEERIEEALSGVLCRCGTYPEIKKAVHRAVKELGHDRERG